MTNILKSLPILLVFILASNFANGQNMDFESYDPPSTLVVPENPVTKAKFPFVDIHSHHWRMGSMDLSID